MCFNENDRVNFVRFVILDSVFVVEEVGIEEVAGLVAVSVVEFIMEVVVEYVARVVAVVVWIFVAEVVDIE